MASTAYIFASEAYEFCGSLWLSTFHGGLQQFTMAAWASSHHWNGTHAQVLKLALVAVWTHPNTQ